VYRFAWQGARRGSGQRGGSPIPARSSTPRPPRRFPRQGLVRWSAPERFGLLHRRRPRSSAGGGGGGPPPYTAVAGGSSLYVSDWGDSTVSIIDLSVSPPVRRSALFVGPHPSALALRGSGFRRARGANGPWRASISRRASARTAHGRTRVARTSGERSQRARPVSPTGSRCTSPWRGQRGGRGAPRRQGHARRRTPPAGWYPTAVATSRTGAPSTSRTVRATAPARTRRHVHRQCHHGLLSIIPVPDSAGLQRYTSRVYALSPFSNPRLGPRFTSDLPPSSSSRLLHPGESDLRSGVGRRGPRHGDARLASSTTGERPTRTRSPLAGVVRQLLRERRGLGRWPRVATGRCGRHNEKIVAPE